MAGDCHQGLPPTSKEGEEGQGQGQPPPRKRKSKGRANRRQGSEGGCERGLGGDSVNTDSGIRNGSGRFDNNLDCGIDEQGANKILEYPIYTEYMQLRIHLVLIPATTDLDLFHGASPRIQGPWLIHCAARLPNLEVSRNSGMYAEHQS